MILRRLLLLGDFLPIQMRCPLLLGVRYHLQCCVWLLLRFWWGMCRLDVSLRTVSDLILDLIHYEIFMIDLIPPFRNFYILQVVLDPSETTITMMVDPIIMMVILRAYAVSNAGSRWALIMMILSVKTPNLSQGSPLPVEPH